MVTLGLEYHDLTEKKKKEIWHLDKGLVIWVEYLNRIAY